MRESDQKRSGRGRPKKPSIKVKNAKQLKYAQEEESDEDGIRESQEQLKPILDSALNEKNLNSVSSLL